MYRNNPLHTGVASDVVPPSLKLKWKQTFGGSVVSSPAVVTTKFLEENVINSRLYVGSDDGNFYALDSTTGNIIWSFNPDAKATAWRSSPAVATVGGQTVIFAGRRDNKFYAIRDDGPTPTKLWEFIAGLPNVFDSSPVVTTIAGTQVVIVGSSDNKLYAFVAATGALYPGWATPFGTAGAIESSPAILGSTVFVGSDGSALYAVNLGNGVELWDSTTAGATFSQLVIGGPVVSSPAIANVPFEGGSEYRVFVGSEDGSMYAFAAATGKLRWSQPVGDKIHSSPALATIPNPPVACAPGPTLAVIFGADNGNVYAMRATDGTPCWTFPSTGHVPFENSPTVSGQTVYIGSDDNNFYAIDINTGTWLWSFPALDKVGDRLGPNAAVSGSTVYFGGGDGSDYRVYAFEGPVATATLTTTESTSTTTTIPVTQTSTVTTATATVSSGTTTQMQTTTQTLTSTVIASTVSMAPPGPVPGFPIESILMGLVGGLVALTLLGRRRRRQSSPA
jgi:outer membrane protein assembly factor BamB